MQRNELERLSRDELIELVLRLQRPEKTSRTSSKPPSADRKERREQAKPGGAKPGHEGHSRMLSTDPDRVVDHAPQQRPCCRVALSPDLPSEAVSVHERIELPEIKPVIEHHRRLAVQCPGCGARVVAAPPPAAAGTPFGPRLHAVATYLKTYQALSYERLQATLADLFGLPVSQGGLMNMLRRAQGCFQAGREQAVAALRCAPVVASDETGVRIEGSNAYHWVFHSPEAVVHHAAPTRAASVVRGMMDGHQPEVWVSDRYAAQRRWCMEASADGTAPDPHGSATDGNRLGFADHAVEYLNAKSDLAVLSGPAASVQLGADQVLVSAHCRFSVVALPVFGSPLPTDAATVGHEPDVAVAWGLLVRISRARHGVGPGWNDHLGRWPGLAGRGGLVDGGRS